MQLTIQLITEAFAKKGYVWYSDRPNLIGVRSAMDVPNVFNDIFCLAWTQQRMPDGLTLKQRQNWLNRNFFGGRTGSKLVEDGFNGPDTKYALSRYNEAIGQQRFRFYQITTDPGVYWLLRPSNPLGTAFLKPGQYVNCWSLGYHQGRQDHPALVQTSAVTVYRDNDRDQLHDDTSRTDTGLFGINIHGASATGTSQQIDRWSAGCQVFASRRDLFDVLALLHLYRERTGNRFTYTLLEEADLK